MKRIRRFRPLLLLLLAALLLTGCSTTGADDLYSLPRRSDIYLELQQAIEAAMGGESYAAPVSGTNQRAIQQADLDGDGVDEVLVFARSDGDKPLKLHILKKQEREYRLLCTIEGDGAAVDSVRYVQLDGEAGMEIVLSRRLTEQVLQAVSVYRIQGERAVELLNTGCASFTLTDLNGDGCTDLFLLSSDATQPNGVAEYYRWLDGELQRDVEADMSAAAESVKRIITGNVTPQTPAVFVASTYDDSNIITDVYAVVDGVFRNISQSDESGLSTGTVRSYFVYSTDIDGDGVIELPTTAALPELEGEPASVGQYRVIWSELHTDGTRTEKCSTYHNYAEGWYLKLQAKWLAALRVTKAQDDEGSGGTVFLQDPDGKSRRELLTVTVLTGEDATTQLESGELVLLQRRGDSYYCARLGEAFDIDITELQGSFGFITTDTTKE